MNGKSVMIGYNRRDPKSVRIAEEICAELTASGFAPLSLKYDDGGTGGLKGAKSSESGEGCVCMITVGGDGSIISHGKLAAGGPIIDPALHCIEYTALCPHSLFSRPMIFSAEREVTLRVNSYQDSRVTINFDGDSGYPFDEGDVLTLHIGSPDLMLIETGEGFFGSVNRKLMQPLR